MERVFKIFLLFQLIWLVTDVRADNNDVSARVEQILAEANIHNSMGSVKALAKLGKPAVPFLLQKLPTYEFPTIIFSALGRIKAPEAVPPLLHYLEGLKLTGKEDITTVRALMAALSDISDKSAEPDLLKILQNQQIDIGIRLYAASTLAKIASENGKKQAQEFILNSPDIRENRSRISPVDLDTAYFEIGTKEAIDKLFQAIKSGLPYEQLFIIDLFATRTSPQIFDGLLNISEDTQYFPDVRFRALEILVKEKSVDRERLLKALIALRKDAPEEGVSKSLVNKKQIDSMIQKLKN